MQDEPQAVCPKCGSTVIDEVERVWRYTPVETWEEATESDGTTKYPKGKTYGLSTYEEDETSADDFPYWCNGCQQKIEEVRWLEADDERLGGGPCSS